MVDAVVEERVCVSDEMMKTSSSNKKALESNSNPLEACLRAIAIESLEKLPSSALCPSATHNARMQHTVGICSQRL
jgi:hypothetical protein